MEIHASRSLGPTTTTVSAFRHTPLVGEVAAHAFSGHMIDRPSRVQSRETGGMRDAPIRMLRIDQVIAVTGLSKTRVHVLQAQGDFTLRVQLSPRRVGRVDSERLGTTSHHNLAGDARSHSTTKQPILPKKLGEYALGNHAACLGSTKT